MHLMKLASDGWNILQTEENKKKLEQQQNKHLRFFAERVYYAFIIQPPAKEAQLKRKGRVVVDWEPKRWTGFA